MTKIFVRLEKGNALTGYQEKRIEYLSTSKEAMQRLLNSGWRWGEIFLVEQEGGSACECDLDPLLEELDILADRGIDLARRVKALEQNGGVNPGPSEFKFDVWGCVDDGEAKITKPSSIKDKFGVVYGNTLSARFTINEGTTLADGVLYIVPEVQPTGYCHFFNGTFVHNCDKHGYMANGVARWHRRNEFGGGKWGIRMQYDTFCLLRTFSTPSKYDLPWMLEGGAWYAQGRSGKVLTAFGGDCFEVTIPFT